MAERSNLALFTIAIAVIGVVIILFQEQLGLTVLFVAILFYAATVVRNRLEKIGAEAFALGSIIVWTGFALFAAPVIGFAWGLFPGSTRIILFIVGIFLIIIGMTTEYYDLNTQFLEFLRRTRKRISVAWERIRKRFFRSIWSILTFFTVIYLVISFFVPQTIEPLPGPEWSKRLQIIGLILLFLAIEFREFIVLTISSLWNFVLIFLKAIVERLRNIPELFSRLLLIAKEWTTSIINFLIRDTYVIGIVGIIVLLPVSLVREDKVLLGLSVVLLLATLSTLLLQRREQIAESIGNVQQRTYRRSVRIRNLVRGSASGNCPHCGAAVKGDDIACYSCKQYLPLCMICTKALMQGQDILTCSQCKYSGHSDHLQNWINMRPICPNCKTSWV